MTDLDGLETFPEPGNGSPDSGQHQHGPRGLRPEDIRRILGPTNGGQEAPSRKPSEGTMCNYLQDGQRLRDKFMREQSIRTLNDVDPLEFARWLLTLKPTLKVGSWRRYRASATAFIGSFPDESREPALALLAHDIGRGRDLGRPSYKKKIGPEEPAKNATRLRAHFVTQKDFNTIRECIPMVSGSKLNGVLDDWLVAAVTTGVRSHEWELCVLERGSSEVRSDCTWLHVVHAKPGSGFDSCDWRTLDITKYANETISAIERIVGICRDWAEAGKAERMRGQVAALFARTCEACLPTARRKVEYALSSLHMQFTLNMASRFEPAIVATLSGRDSAEVERETHLHHKLAWEEIHDIPAAIETQVKKTRTRLELSLQRLNIAAQKMRAKQIREERRNARTQLGMLVDYPGE
jgi:hypothetical protein